MSRLRLILLTAAAGALVVPGCVRMNVKPGAKSIFEVLGPQMTPEDAAAWAVDRYDPDKRYRGTLYLGSQPFAGEVLYIRLFVDNIRDEDARVRVAAARALANHGGPEHVPLLVDLLDDDEAFVRLEGVRGLQRLHNPVAIDALIIAVREPDLDRQDQKSEPSPQVRAEAASALGQYAALRVLQPLIEALNDSHLAVNYNALASLRTLTGQNFGYDRRAWLDWTTANRDAFAAQSVYMFPHFSRSKKWYEYIPFVPPPPNEGTAPPQGFPLPQPR